MFCTQKENELLLSLEVHESAKMYISELQFGLHNTLFCLIHIIYKLKILCKWIGQQSFNFNKS